MSSLPAELTPALAWSGYFNRRLQARPELADWLTAHLHVPIDEACLANWYDTLRQQQPHENAAVWLRRLREQTFLAIMARDLGGQAPLEEVTGAMTALADLAVNAAYRQVVEEMRPTHGIPRAPGSNLPQEMMIVGMGKLGGCELNVSSDIDLIMLYDEEGETDGPRRISHHEYYGRLTRRMMPILSENTAWGHVFRTDLRLRPDGDSGPLAWSLGALERYLVTQGREWERYAWLKARLMPCKAFDDSQPQVQEQQLESLRRPFVYRKYFDFDALSALRDLRERIRQDWQLRALRRSGLETGDNVKLGAGGIREIEFIAQLFQLVRGGRMPTLQTRNLLQSLHAEREAGLLQHDTADALEQAYRFLRRTEHALQYREDEQTHLLPAEAAQRARLAEALGLSHDDFEHTLRQHRTVVETAFRDVFRLAGMESGEPAPCLSLPAHSSLPADKARTDNDLASLIQTHFPDQAEAVIERTEALLGSSRIRRLPETSRRRLEALLPELVQAAAQTDAPWEALTRLFDLVEHIAQRSVYLALMTEYPGTLVRIARLMSASPWAAKSLMQYPLLLDGLLDWHSLMAPIDMAQVGQQLRAGLDACRLPDGQPDVEHQMDLLRDSKHQISFQLLAQDLEGLLSVEALADQLSALADMLLEEILYRNWPYPEAPNFAVIAYGRLGGKELGYASDLDLVFLYDDAHELAGQRYAKLGQRLSLWLSTMTPSGRLYEIDLRLRPDGNAGLLALPLDAFEQYQRNHAWVWEHQALSRARFAAGDADVGTRFEQIRREILLLPRDPASLADEIRAMRVKIDEGHPNRSELFDLKHDSGGMVDIEFIVQYLVLLHSRIHPELLDNLGNITLLRLAGEAGLIPLELAQRVADAYRAYRAMQHRMRLQGAEKARIDPGRFDTERQQVRTLWQHVLG